MSTVQLTSYAVSGRGDNIRLTDAYDIIDAGFDNGPDLIVHNSLDSEDTIDGGGGYDILNADFIEPATVRPTLRNVESVVVQHFSDYSTPVVIDLSKSTGVQNVGTNAPSPVMFINVPSKLVSATVSDVAGLIVRSQANAVYSTSDSIAVFLTNVGDLSTDASGNLVKEYAPVVLPGYEKIEMNVSGLAVCVSLSTPTDMYTAGTQVRLFGKVPVLMNTGTSMNPIGIDASGMLGSYLDLVALAPVRVTLKGSIGNDSFERSAWSSLDVVDGGAGTDRIVMPANVALSSAGAGGISNVELLSLSTPALAGTYTPSKFAGVNGLELQKASAASFTVNFAAGTANLVLDHTQTGTLTLNSAGTGTNDVLVLNVQEQPLLNPRLNGFENVVMNLSQSCSIGDIALPTTRAMEMLKLSSSGSSPVNVQLGKVKADYLDASGLSGNLTMSRGNSDCDYYNSPWAGMRIDGGRGSDLLIGTAASDIINGGAGADRLELTGGIRASGGYSSIGDYATGGAGADVFRIVPAAAGQLPWGVIHLGDFTGSNWGSASDHIELVGTGFTGIQFAREIQVTTGGLDGIYAAVAASGLAASTATQASAVEITFRQSGVELGSWLFINDRTQAVDPQKDLLISLNPDDPWVQIIGSDFKFSEF